MAIGRDVMSSGGQVMEASGRPFVLMSAMDPSRFAPRTLSSACSIATVTGIPCWLVASLFALNRAVNKVIV